VHLLSAGRDRDLRHPRRPGRRRTWNRRNQPRIHKSGRLADSGMANNAAFVILTGEPTQTVLANLLLSGLLTAIVAVALEIWSVLSYSAAETHQLPLPPPPPPPPEKPPAPKALPPPNPVPPAPEAEATGVAAEVRLLVRKAVLNAAI
jgi:hypothetical protein